MSYLNEDEMKIAEQIKSSDLDGLDADTKQLQAVGFKDGVVSEDGRNSCDDVLKVTNVAYKVMKNRASDLSKATAKMSDIAQRYGRDNKAYDTAQSSYHEALAESNDAVLRHQILSNTKKDINKAVVNGMTF